MNKVIINGKSYEVPDGCSVSVQGNKLYINGVLSEDFNDWKEKNINITVDGNCKDIKVDNGIITINGTSNNIEVSHGNVSIKGSIQGNAKVDMGNIRAGSIQGNASTNMGNVNGRAFMSGINNTHMKKQSFIDRITDFIDNIFD